MAADIQRKDDTTHKVSVEVSTQKPKDVETEVKMEDNPAYDGGVQVSITDVRADHKSNDRNMRSPAQGSKDSSTTDNKEEDDPSMQPTVHESTDAITSNDKTEDNTSSVRPSSQELKNEDVKIKSACETSEQSTQQTQDLATVDIKVEDSPAHDSSVL